MCGTQVCFSPADTVALAKYTHAVAEAKKSLAGCNLVDWTP